MLRIAPAKTASGPVAVQPRSNIGVIASNTPAFEAYGFNLMLTNGNLFREKWHLDIPEPLTVSNVYFTLLATGYGVKGAVATRDHRFRWSFINNGLLEFADTNYSHTWLRPDDNAQARLSKVKSKITAQKAEAIARVRLHQLGLTEKQLQLIEPPEVNQYQFEETNGTVYPLPLFNVAWGEQRGEQTAAAIVFQISGITRQVVDYSMLSMRHPPTPLPTNYFDILGVRVPTNYEERWGYKPLKPLAPKSGGEK